jgi:hypothetical protein
MQIKDALSAVPVIFLLSVVGCTYVLSTEEDPAPTQIHTQTASASPEGKDNPPDPAPATKTPATPTLEDNEILICDDVFTKTPVTNVMRAEISRIAKEYPYICDISWTTFESDDAWGRAWTPGARVEINSDFEGYRIYDNDPVENLEFQIRETVRHEFGHQVIFQHFGRPGIDDDKIVTAFGYPAPDPISGVVSENYTADEMAADIIAAALNPDTSSPFVTRYSEPQIFEANHYLDITESLR